MDRGGYALIDLRGESLDDSDAVVIKGIYERIEGTRKALLISGLVDGRGASPVEYHDMFATNVKVVSTDYVVTVGDFNLTITDDDEVTISDAVTYATTTTPGSVIVGDGLTITSAGVLSVSGS